MIENQIFSDLIKNNAAKIMEEINAEKELSSWQLKVKLHLSGSALFLALGYLAAKEQIQIIPMGLTHKIVLNNPVQN